MIRVQLRRQIRKLRLGDILEVPDGVGELWLRYGWAERLVPPQTIEVELEEPPATGSKNAKRNRRRTAEV